MGKILNELVFSCTLLLLSLRIDCSVVEKTLLDSTSYQGELNWDKEAFGDSLELPGWKEQSFNPKSSNGGGSGGGVGDVWRVHFVCDIASSNPNNWLRLPHVARDEANRLVIKLEYTIRECKRYPGEIRSCKETFQMLYAESEPTSNGGYSPPPEFSESSYRYLKTIAPNSGGDESSSPNTSQRKTATSTMTTESVNPDSTIFRTQVDLPLSTNAKGVYIVFRDQGACVSLLSIKISYTMCASQVHNLVLYPRTPTGSNLTDLIKKSGQCIANAEAKTTPYAYCQTNGNWFFANSDDSSNGNACFCKPGYYYSMLNTQCLACPQGRYKASTSNQAECSQCPDYSYSSTFASSKCTCIDGYYRINKDDIDSPCLPYPPEPKNLTVYYLDETSVKLRWNLIDNYDKSTVEYKLDCFKCVDGKEKKPNSKTTTTSMSTTSHQSTACHERQACESYVQKQSEEGAENRVTLSSLDSDTSYVFELHAEHLGGVFKTKTVDVLVRTLTPISSLRVRNLSAYQFVDMNQILVLWGDADSDQLFSLYEIRYWPKGNMDKANVISIRAPARNFTFKNSNPNVISSTQYVFQIRAKTARGWTTYTEPPTEAVKISSVSFFYSKENPSVLLNSSASIYSDLMATAAVASSVTLDQRYSSANIKISNSSNTRFSTHQLSEGVTIIYIIIACLSSLCLVILILGLLLVLTRSSSPSGGGRLHAFLCNYLSSSKSTASSSSSASSSPRHHHRDHNDSGKPVMCSASNSECDSIEFAKNSRSLSLAHHATMLHHGHQTVASSHYNNPHLVVAAYNQLSSSSGGTTVTTTSHESGSGGSSPAAWPLKTYIDPHTYEDPTKVVSLFARELPPASIIIESVIGGGEFGDVCKGCLKLNPWTDVVVAIKTLKGAATEQNRCDFLTEASIMAQFTDPNVIRLEGVVTQSHPLMIVTEFMENGSLDSYLRVQGPKLKMTQLVRMLRDVASGMRYLSEMNYIHRDLAARNILVNRDLVCKVADFGLSREIDVDAYEYTTKGGKIPIRWTAPEACNFRKYSCASDVWSFGVVCWEVLSFGERPYWSWENKDVVRALQECYRLPPPPNCPDCVYKLMLRCWLDERNQRPKFAEIVELLDEMLANSASSDELRRPSRVREALAINPRAPTKVQLTSTRTFLARLGLDHYRPQFECAGFGNLSKLFHLDANDLAILIGVGLQYDQKRIIDELKRLGEAINAQNSYTLMSMNKNTMHHQHHRAQPQPQRQMQPQHQQSIFNIIRSTNGSSASSSSAAPLNSNDLLSFAAMPVNNSNQSHQQATNGFLV